MFIHSLQFPYEITLKMGKFLLKYTPRSQIAPCSLMKTPSLHVTGRISSPTEGLKLIRIGRPLATKSQLTVWVESPKSMPKVTSLVAPAGSDAKVVNSCIEMPTGMFCYRIR